MSRRKLETNDDTRDLAIQLTDKLVELGLIPNCIDTDNEDEFEVQDEFHDIINKFVGVEA